MRVFREKVFRGRLFNVFRSKKILPNGVTGYFEEVDHPGAVIILPVFKGKIIFIRQYRAVIGKYIWELPAGKLDGAESPYSCARREIIEETGYRVKRLKKVGYIYTTPGFCNEKIHVFRADCANRKEAEREPDEIISVRHFTRKDVRRMFANGRIPDAKTISALCMTGVL